MIQALPKVENNNTSPSKQSTNGIINNSSPNNNYTTGTEINYNLGKIENRQNFTHVFHLSKNVKSARATCGCVTTDLNLKVPKSVMTIFHGIANYKGTFAKSVAVTYEDGTTETLYLKGELN